MRAALGLWVAWLAGEGRVWAHTVAAYGRDLAGFLDFLTGHLGELPTLAGLGQLSPADFRARLAERARRVVCRPAPPRPPLAPCFFRLPARRRLPAPPAHHAAS